MRRQHPMKIGSLVPLMEGILRDGRRPSGPLLARAAAAALAGLLLAALPRPAVAQIDFGFGKIPVWGNFTDIHCVEDTDEWSDDEPYVVMAAIDLNGSQPAVRVNRSVVFRDDLSMDDGDSRHAPATLWGITGFAEPIRGPT